MGGPLTGESAHRRGGGGGWGSEPRGEPSDPQYSQAYRHQTSCRMLWGELNIPAMFKAQLIPAADRVQAPEKNFAACFIADAFALP